MTKDAPRPSGWLMTAAACLWLGLFPLWQDGSYSRITHAKWTGMLALCALTVLLALGVTVVLGLRRQLRGAVQHRTARWLALAYLALVAFSAWQGRLADALNSRGEPVVLMGAVRYEGLYTQLCYGLILLALSLHPVRLRTATHAAAAGLMLFCGVAALQYAGVNALGLFPGNLSLRTNYEFQSTIGNIDMVSGYLALALPLVLMGYVLSPRRSWPWLIPGFLGATLMACMEVQSGLIATLALCGLTVLTMLRRPQTRSRGLCALATLASAFALRQMLRLPWLDGTPDLLIEPLTPSALALLALSAALLAAAWLLRKRPGPAMPLRWVICLTLAAAIAVVAAVALLPIPDSMGGLYELHECLQGRPQDHYGSWRVGAWRHTLLMSRQSLLTGTGPDTFLYAMSAHLSETGAALGETIDAPHNEYLAILANNGLPALIAYVAMLTGAVWSLLRRSRRTPTLLAPAAAIVCYALQAAFSLSVCVVTPLFFATLGIALSATDAPASAPPRAPRP